MDRVDGVEGLAALVACALLPGLLAATLAGCYEVGSSSSDAGAPDADSDTDTDADSDSDTDQVELSPGFEDDLTAWGGCGDVFLYGWGAYGVAQVELVFSFQGLALYLYELGEHDAGRFFDLPDGEVMLEVRLGLDMAADECTDEGTGDGVVWRTYAPVSGEANLWVTATSEEWTEWDLPALADLELIDVVLAAVDDDAGDPVPLPYLFVENISVGWFPG